MNGPLQARSHPEPTSRPGPQSLRDLTLPSLHPSRSPPPGGQWDGRDVHLQVEVHRHGVGPAIRDHHLMRLLLRAVLHPHRHVWGVARGVVPDERDVGTDMSTHPRPPRPHSRAGPDGVDDWWEGGVVGHGPVTGPMGPGGPTEGGPEPPVALRVSACPCEEGPFLGSPGVGFPSRRKSSKLCTYSPLSCQPQGPGVPPV